MKVLITGAGGFVGDALCRRLYASKHRVIGTFRTEPAPRDWMETQTTGDLTQFADFKKVVENADVVIHLAARAHMTRDTVAASDTEFRRANIEVTQRLAQAAADSGAGRFIFLSSVKVNGEETSGVPFSEVDVPAPEDSYGRSKRDAEDALCHIAATTKMSVTTLRVPLVYGPSVRANFAALIRICDTILPLPLGGISQNRRSFLYLGNLTHAIEAVVSSESDPSGTYFLSDQMDLSTADLVDHLRSSLNRQTFRLPLSSAMLRSIGALAGKQATVRRLCGSLQVDSTAFQKAFGWTPPFSPVQGIAATVAEHRKRR